MPYTKDRPPFLKVLQIAIKPQDLNMIWYNHSYENYTKPRETITT